MERTLILVKPDAFARGLTGEIVARFERKGLKIVAARHLTVTEELANQHYAEHEGKPFFGELVEFITSGPIVALVLEGEQAIKAARQVIGATNPLEAAPGSIRGDFAISVGQNMVHGSDSPESGEREAKLFFGDLYSSLPARRSGARSSSRWASRSWCSPPASTSSPPATRSSSPGRTRAARRWRCRGSSCSAPTPTSRSTARSWASRATPSTRGRCWSGSPPARTSSWAGSPSPS